ncbi:MAG: class I SAM-dependent methyltransferase, partial [Rufibacter sp.]
MVENFKDLFSKQAQTYQQFRPTYPPALFQYLQSLTPNHNLAWDCGTGNGQSAVGLASYFGKVYGTDPSTSQIENAQPHPRIRYNVEKSEECSLPDASVDLVTVAQALHWFNFDKFYAQVRRVLRT